VIFGFSHQRTITREQKAEAERHRFEHQTELISKAKAEYARLKNPQPSAGMLVTLAASTLLLDRL
jgi:F-type H+-transporting ATP synthase subunit e